MKLIEYSNRQLSNRNGDSYLIGEKEYTRLILKVDYMHFLVLDLIELLVNKMIQQVCYNPFRHHQAVFRLINNDLNHQDESKSDNYTNHYLDSDY